MMSTEENKKKNDAEQKVNVETEEVVLSKLEYEQLQNRLKELEGMKENLLRSAAEFENAKKRLIREKEEFIKFGLEKLLRNLLPVLDGFERALSHAGEADQSKLKNVVTGIQMIFKQFSDVLKNEGLKKLETKGEIFDPHYHEAIAYVEEEGKDHEIIDEVETGYLLHERLLRPAKVRVRNSPASSNHSKEDDKEDPIT